MEITVHGEKTAKCFLRLQLRPHTQKMRLHLQMSLVWKLEEQGIRSGFPTGFSVLSPLPVAETWSVV